MKNAKAMRRKAELAAVHYAYITCHCTHVIKALRNKFQRQDLFCCDIVGKQADGRHVYIQVTAGQAQAVTARRRKLEQVPWHPDDIVLLLQLITLPDPANARRKQYFFRVHEYEQYLERRWRTKDEAFLIPREWFKAYREDRDG